MPDARQPGRPAPEDWGQAFAALPLETPPAHGWNRVAAALPARRSRSRLWIPAAAAACLALAIAVPWRGTAPDQSPPVAVTAPPSITVPGDAPATTPVASIPSPAPVRTDPSATGTDTPAIPASAPGRAPLETGLASTPGRKPVDRKPPTREASMPVPVPANARTDASGEQRTASIGPAKHTHAPARADSGTAGTPASPAVLETLYAESAQLEALLSQIRDDRMASGPAMALSAALNERVAGIDVALSQPDLAADTRVGLWRERVAVLQRLTGVEGTQRWMAANGYQADGAVAQVY
ncbi:hypothetical protein ACWKWK_10180 [Pseudoxanthomonas beigongshangi]